MPEEINRLVSEAITNYFFTTSVVANENMRCSGISEEIIFFIGNTKIDTLLRNRSKFLKPKLWDEIGLKDNEFIMMTLHRPTNVDKDEKLYSLIARNHRS
jgi:UDP-N-acetylglucosamine 2-epimerase (non-hydrolysing)